MPIYSRNRVSGTVIASENYTDRDFGRIMYECALNDQKVFNAAIANDFREISAVREGTMLESELVSFREFSAREAWEGLKKKVKKLWEKIKGVFRAVFAKLSVWFVRNGKAFVKLHKKYLLSKSGLDDCEIPRYRAKKSKFSDLVAAGLDKEKSNLTFEDVVKNTYGDKDSSDMAEEMFGALLGTASCNASEFHDKFIEACFEDEETNVEYRDIKRGYSMQEMFSTIENGGKAIKDLKKAEKAADKKLSALVKKLDKAAADEKKYEKDQRTNYANASKFVSATQTYVTAVVRASIAATKLDVKQCRMVLGKLVAYTPKSSLNDSAMLESMAWLEGADDFDEVEDINPAEAEAEDVQSDPDVVVNINVDGDDD